MNEEFSFAEKKASAHEIIRMQIYEGACLSVLGTVGIDGDGNLYMTNLVAVMAGGIVEAKRQLNNLSRHNKVAGRIFLAISTISLTAAVYCGYLSYEHRKQAKENQDAQEMLHLKKMPTVKAEEMGTQCLICYTNPSNVVLVPCNHLCMCSECHWKQK